MEQRWLHARHSASTGRGTAVQQTTHEVCGMNGSEGGDALNGTHVGRAVAGSNAMSYTSRNVEWKPRNRQRLLEKQCSPERCRKQSSATVDNDQKVNDSETLPAMMALDGDIRRRMTVMNNHMQKSPMRNSPLYPSNHPVPSLMLGPHAPSDSRTPHSLSDGSMTNSSNSHVSSARNHLFGGPVTSVANDKVDNGRANGNECTALIPRDPLYEAFAPWSPPPVTSVDNTAGNTTITAATAEADDHRPSSRNPGVPSSPESYFITDESQEIFARKVFVGGLPIDVTEDEITSTFSQFGAVLVDWPRRPDSGNKERSTARYMTGYVFLVFEDERSVQLLVSRCHKEDDKYYLFVSSPTMRDKPVQVRPWRLADMEFMLHEDMPLNPRRTIFIGGVPRPTKAYELARVLDILYGSVCYVGIDIDPELKYPKGAARVTFATEQSFIAAISGRFVHIPHADLSKRVEIKPYVMDEQMCDECEGLQCSGRYAPYFCGDVTCLQYFCESCWDSYHYGEHSDEKKASHKPLVRIGDQTKLLAHPPHHNHTSASKMVSPALNCCRHADTATYIAGRGTQHY